MTCGCNDPRYNTILQCPVAMNNNLEYCKGFKTTSPVLVDEPCERCAALFGHKNPEKVRQYRESKLDEPLDARNEDSPAELSEVATGPRDAGSDDESLHTVKAGFHGSDAREVATAMEEMAIAGDPKIGDEHVAPKPNPASDIATNTPPTAVTASTATATDDHNSGLPFNAPPVEIKDAAEKETLMEAVEKIVEFVEETRDVEITHHDKHAGHALEHGETVTVSGIVALDEDTSAEVTVKVVKD